MTKVLDRLSDLAMFIGGLSLFGMTSAVSYQVVARYFFNASPAWSERLALVLLAYLVFFGAAAGVHRGAHIRISALEDRLHGPAKDKVTMLAHVGVLTAGLVIALAGTEITMRLWSYPIPALGWPRGLALLPVPLSGMLMVVFALNHIRNSTGER